jgi:hypothetical protein
MPPPQHLSAHEKLLKDGWVGVLMFDERKKGTRQMILNRFCSDFSAQHGFLEFRFIFHSDLLTRAWHDLGE